MKIRRNQSGFSGTIALLLIVILAVAGFAAWRIMSRDNDKPDSSNTSVSQDSEAPSDTLTYISKTEGLKFDYPASWETKPETNEIDGKDYDSVFLTSPNGAEIVWASWVDGLGGFCEEGVDPNFVLTKVEKVEGLDDIYYVEADRGEEPGFIALTNYEAVYGEGDGTLKTGDTGSCFIIPTLPIKAGTGIGFFRVDAYGSNLEADLPEIRAILKSARY